MIDRYRILNSRFSLNRVAIMLAFISLTVASVNGQGYCITVPADFTWNCEEEDYSFVYQSSLGVEIYQCIDPTTLISVPINIDVSIEEFNCSNTLYPGVVRRISRTFTADVGNLVDNTGCGIGLVCGTQIIEIIDTQSPSFISVPADVTRDCIGWNLEEYLLAQPFPLDYQDNCGTPELLNTLQIVDDPTCPSAQSFIWSFTITDVCGNSATAYHTVSVVDTTPPLIVFAPSLQDIGIANCADEVVWPLLSAVELCSASSVEWADTSTITTTPLSCQNHYTLTRVANSLDECGNASSSEFQIIVQDTLSPIFTSLLPDLTISCEDDLLLQAALVSLPLFEDVCAGELVYSESIDSVPSGLCSQNYSLIRTYNVTDACNNATEDQVQTIIIQDTVSPIITPELGFTQECSLPLSVDLPNVFDNCDNNVISDSIQIETIITNQTSIGTYTSTIIYTIEDACGNSSTDSTVISIVDTTPPFFTNFPEDLVLNCGEGYPDDQAAYEDACDPNAYIFNYDLQFDFQDCANNTVITRTFTITDDAGNLTDSTQVINYLDTEPPILITPLDSMFYQCAYEMPNCTDMWGQLELEFDDCSMGEVVIIDCADQVVEGNCLEQACVIERTYYFEDACGNVGNASHFIRVQETVLTPTMPTGMTPNGDGYNDTYVILDIGPSIGSSPEEVQCSWLPNTRFRVINRWGQIVFETIDYRNDWSGINKSGEELPPGTYFVVFEAEGVAFSTYVDIRR
ncbi:MAG: hypothetical protein COA49_03155 [Bacteroidetes bacterium]|nr:MAG: hypothetical protein COA49_03155 [Bacteroidota bacterium]